MQTEIDFVVLWVDSNDPSWQIERAKYSPRKSDDVGIVRYQNWDNLKYWFRSVAQNAPWVRKIHLVTNGQVPDWLDTNHPKVNLVKHSDYMPASALPTFNSNAIEVGIHKMRDLSDSFVLFNDDMFLISSVDCVMFFRNGIPVDMPGLISPPKKVPGNVFSSLLFNNSQIMQKYFRKKDIFAKHKKHWFNPEYGKAFLRTLFFGLSPYFPGFIMPHLSTAYLKQDFEKVWGHEAETLTATQHNRFRSENDVTHFLFRNWRMCTGDFVPAKSKGKYFNIDGIRTAKRAAKAIRFSLYPEICLNETCTGETFEEAKKIINAAFEEKYPQPCEFELQHTLSVEE